jgi:hypothetical protein
MMLHDWLEDDSLVEIEMMILPLALRPSLILIASNFCKAERKPVPYRQSKYYYRLEWALLLYNA